MLVLVEQARDCLLGPGRREDVLSVEEQTMLEVSGLGGGLGLRGVVLVLSVFTYLPKGIYGAWLLFFVSARTNKRHHHHLLAYLWRF